MKKIIFFWVLIFLFAASCKQTNITSEAPDKLASSQVFERKLSTINIPVSFPIKQLEARLNQELNGVLYNDNDLKGDNVKVKITKIGNIAVNAENNKISFTIPLNIWALGSWEWQACDFCPKLAKSESTAFDMNLKFETQLALTENWQVKTSTKGNYEWGKQKPYLEFGPIKIPLQSVIDLALEPQVDKLTARLDKEIQNKINIKQYVQKAWNDLQQPILLDKNMNAWLSISPQSVSVTPLQTQNNEVSMKIGVKSYIEMITGTKPQQNINPALPKLVTDNKLQDDFQVGLIGEISYEQATAMIKKEIQNKVYNLDNNKYQLKILDLALSGSGDKLLMQADVDGKNAKGKKVAGRIFIEGIPYYDVATQSVKVRDFDYNLKTKNVLLKSASWLVNKGFLGQIEEKLTFPMKDHISNAQKMVQDGLTKNGRISPNVLLKGNITNLAPEGIYLTPTGIKAVVNAQGKINVLVDKI
ncbi:MAG: DUF4403 family protein [Sphingobacteriales bacterium]|nr:MAG: DUF4403 family protein [Sphingobacteriales bacterium]